MLGSILALVAAAAAPPAAAPSDEVSVFLDSLAGKWAIVETKDGKQSSGSEGWSVATPGQMYVETRETGTGDSRNVGTAAVWQASKSNWRGVWCTPQQGCFPLRFEMHGGEMIVRADESAPAQAQGVRERFHMGAGGRLEQTFELCSAPDACRPLSATHGNRR